MPSLHMFKISIVMDTNVMLSNLELIKQLYNCQMPLPYTINYSKTVVTELENLKKSKVEARNAIRFLESIVNSLKTEIEGRIDDRKVEVVIETRDPIKITNNDDKILNYCFQLENPILLTNDKAFYLKCVSFNIKAIVVGNKSIKDLISAILQEFGMVGREAFKEVQSSYVSRIRASLKKTLLPSFFLIIQRELGVNYDLVVKPDEELDYYLDFVVKNFFLFRNFLPGNAPEIIKKFLKNLKEENIDDIKDMIHVICMIFRKSAPEDIL